MEGFDAPAPLLPELLALHARWRGPKPALIADNGEGEARVLSWRAMNAAANQVAHALLAEGLGRGDCVAVVMDNRPETLVVHLGVIKAGGVTAPLNLTVTDEAVAAMIADCDAPVVFASADQAGRLDAFTAGRRRIAVGGAAGWLDFHAWCSKHPETEPPVTVSDDDPVNVIYSSGTTGRPKGIVHTHRRRLDWAGDLALALRYHSGARTLCTPPLYSNISWVMMLCTLVAGGTLRLAQRFDAGRFLELVAEEALTHTALVPVQFQRIVDHPGFGSARVGSLQAMMSCGSPLHPKLKTEVMRRFPCGVIELYGLTEGVITTLDPEDADGRVESVGRPLPGTDIRIIDDHGRVVGPEVPGEIVSRGRILMAGYLNRDDANAETSWMDETGRRWLRTGDLGRIDEAGFLYIVGRKKDMILSGGQNIYPADIEAVLVTHPEVADAAVIGVPSERWGETPLALVEAAEGCSPDPEALQAWVNGRVGRFQRVSGVEVVAELPRNPNGKVLKQVLRDGAGSGDRTRIISLGS